MKDEQDAGGTPAARGDDGPVGPRGGWSAAARWAGVVVAVVTLLAMGRLCGMEFTWWDDNRTIHHNPLMNPPTWETLRHYWTHAYMGLYVPVTYTVWAGLAAIARVSVPNDQGIALNPWVFHTANVLVHVANALLVYAILRRVVRKPWAAAAGALVFGVHPVQVEAVGWVSGMKDLLCGTCVLGAVWNYLVYAQGGKEDGGMGGRGDGEKRRRWVHYGAALVLTGVGTLCKPTAVVTPVLLGVVDLWVVGRGWKRVARDVWPFAAAVLPCVVWAKAVQNVGARAPVWARPGIAADALAFYAWKLVWPARLAVEYGHNPAYVMRLGWWRWTWLVPAAIGVWAWAGRRRRPALVAAAGLFVGGLLPVLGFTPFMFQRFSTTADHYLYLPMLGVAVAVAWAAARWSGRGTAIVVGVVVAAMASRSAGQAGYWADEETLDRHTLAVNPQSSVAHTNLASALQYLGLNAGSPELMREAEWHLREAIRLEPAAVIARENLATIKIQQGKVDEAIQLLLDAIAVSDQAPPEEREALGPSHRALGMVLAKRGRLEEAAAQYRAALEYEPGSKAIEGELADVERRMAKKDEKGGNVQRPTSNVQR